MRIALFGSNSSITKSLIPLLIEENELITLGRSNANIIVDINAISKDFELPRNLDTLLLSSAYFGGIGVDDYLSAININIIGSLKLFDLAIKSNVKQFIYISSIYRHFEVKSPFSTIYSLSKKCSEEILLQYAKDKQIKLAIIRPSQIIGNFESNRKHQPFFYSLLKKIKNSEDVIFNGKNDPKRNFIHIDDLSLILKKVISTKLEGVYDCAFPQDTSFLEIANHAKALYKSKSNIYFDETKPNILDNVFEYNFQLFDKINYYPKTSILEGFEKITL